MGQHRVQRALLNNFAFPGHQKNSMMVWTLDAKERRPHRKSVKKTGFFDTECSPQVDKLITRAEQEFLPVLTELGKGNFRPFHNGVGHRKMIQFIAFHYVRSNTFNNQIAHLTTMLVKQGYLSPDQAKFEAARLTSHQHRKTYIELTAAVASCLTYFTISPITVTGSSNFITSDNILAVFQNRSTGTGIWFPIGPRHGIWAEDETSTKQILGPTPVVNGRISFPGIHERPFLAFQDTPPHEREEHFFATANSVIAKSSQYLFAHAKEDIDLAITSGSEDTSQYIYVPPHHNLGS